ncbi:MAG: M20/M25/M40 family metallo-hydrolase [Verrucomicrobiae bacterium]|nr:M20/M25/M40 family metallo-hydrolase [Verrucomicrobiae bacterium]
MYTLLKNKSAGLGTELVSFAQDLVRQNSVSLDEDAAAGLVEKRMNAVGFDKVFRDDAGNVAGLILGRESEPVILLNSHLDTVSPAKGKTADAPEAGSIEKGRLYGLGAADCKGGLAAQIYAGALLKRSLLPLRGHLVVAATVAEENGCSVGVRTLIEKTLPEMGLKPNFAILGEPTGLGLYYGHDGWMEMDILIEGANPFHVDDAAMAIFNDFGKRGGISSGENRLETMSIRQPSFEKAEGCHRATIPMTRRLLPDEDEGGVLKEVQHEAGLVAQSSGMVAVEVMVREEKQRMCNGRTTVVKHLTNAWETDPFHPLLARARQSLAAAGCEAKPGKWRLGRLGMGTAGSVLVKEFGIPTIGYGPGLEEQAHRPGEWVEVARMSEAVYGTAAIVHGLIGVPVCGWTTDEI